MAKTSNEKTKTKTAAAKSEKKSAKADIKAKSEKPAAKASKPLKSSAPTTQKVGGKTKGAKAATDPTHDQIAARAHEIWLDKGRPFGQDEQNWLDAVESFKSR